MEDNDETLIRIDATTDTPRPWVAETIAYVSALYSLGWTGALWAALDAESPQPLCWALGLGVIGCLSIPLFVGGRERFYVVAQPGRLTRRGRTWLAASDVEACSTGRLRDGRISVALAVRQHEAFFFAVDSDADAAALSRSLGIAEGGSGDEIALPFRNERRGPHRSQLAMTVTLTATLLAVLSILAGPRQLAPALVVALAFLGLGLALLRARHRRSRRTPNSGASVVLARHEVRTPTDDVFYGDIRGIRYDETAIEIDRHQRPSVRIVKSQPSGDSTTTFLNESDSEHLMAHLLAAAQRAAGPARVANELPRELAVRDAAEWLSTLDLAAERLETKASYREAPIDPAAIEAVLRDADQPPAVRAAAARVLLRAGRERLPIEEVLATFHGEGTTKAARIAAGLDGRTDAEAARALDALVLCRT